jgi:hypothetical protein
LVRAEQHWQEGHARPSSSSLTANPAISKVMGTRLFEELMEKRMAFQETYLNRVEIGCSKLKFAHRSSLAHSIRSETNDPQISYESAQILIFQRLCLELLLPSAQMFHLFAFFERIPAAFVQCPAFLLMLPHYSELACERLSGIFQCFILLI